MNPSSAPLPTGKLDSAEAALALGQMLLDSGNATAAVESFAAAARAGNAAALNMLGRCHERGWGGPADAVLAAAYYRRASAAGEPWAMFNLADLHFSGRGIAQDDHAAHRLYAEAASRGHGKALNMLGIMAESGRGPDRPDAALPYFTAAAEAGDCWGQFNAARLLLAQGCAAAALRWLDLSLATGFPGYWQAMADALAPHPDPRLRDLAARARARLNGYDAPQQETPC